MKSKPNYNKPAFAPETEFQVETLTLLSDDKLAEDCTPLRNLHLSTESEFGFVAHESILSAQRLIQPIDQIRFP